MVGDGDGTAAACRCCRHFQRRQGLQRKAAQCGHRQLAGGFARQARHMHHAARHEGGFELRAQRG
jgi:hypothetical protein